MITEETPRGLCLTVRDGDQIQIGPDIRVTFNKRYGGRLIIDAPRNVEVRRHKSRVPHGPEVRPG